jgi:hypothetical protein
MEVRLGPNEGCSAKGKTNYKLKYEIFSRKYNFENLAID